MFCYLHILLPHILLPPCSATSIFCYLHILLPPYSATSIFCYSIFCYLYVLLPPYSATSIFCYLHVLLPPYSATSIFCYPIFCYPIFCYPIFCYLHVLLPPQTIIDLRFMKGASVDPCYLARPWNCWAADQGCCHFCMLCMFMFIVASTDKVVNEHPQIKRRNSQAGIEPGTLRFLDYCESHALRYRGSWTWSCSKLTSVNLDVHRRLNSAVLIWVPGSKV